MGVRTLSSLVEDLGSVPIAHRMIGKLSVTPVPGDLALFFLTFVGIRHSCHLVYMCAGKTLRSIKIIKVKKKIKISYNVRHRVGVPRQDRGGSIAPSCLCVVGTASG